MAHEHGGKQRLPNVTLFSWLLAFSRHGTLGVMSDATRLIEAAVAGDPKAAADLLPLVYDELSRQNRTWTVAVETCPWSSRTSTSVQTAIRVDYTGQEAAPGHRGRPHNLRLLSTLPEKARRPSRE
jgi:hypothetical protein